MTQVYDNKISDDVEVTADVGYGRGVTLKVCPGSLSWEWYMEPDQAREIGLALMDAANAVDKPTRHDDAILDAAVE